MTHFKSAGATRARTVDVTRKDVSHPWAIVEIGSGNELDVHDGFIFDLVPACRKDELTALLMANTRNRTNDLGLFFIAVPVPTNE